MGSLVYECPTWVESGARVTRRSEPTRYCDGVRWREMMRKEIVGEGYGKVMQRDRGAARHSFGDTRANQRWHLKKLIRDLVLTLTAGLSDGVGYNKYHGPTNNNWALGLKNCKIKGQALKGPRDGVGYNNYHGPRNNSWAMGFKVQRTKGWDAHKSRLGGPSKELKGVVRGGSKWDMSSDLSYGPRAFAQAQEVGPTNKQLVDPYTVLVEEPESMRINGLKGIEESNVIKYGLEGLGSGGVQSQAVTPSFGRDEGSLRREEQEADGSEEMIEVHDQEYDTPTETRSEGDNWEGIDLAIVPLEHNQIEPIDSVGPEDEESRPSEVGDWILDRGGVSVSLTWARRKLKGFGKFLGISYGGKGRDGGRSRGMRELKNWEWSVSEGRRKGRGRSWPKGHKENVEDGYIWAFAGVYGPHNRRDRLRVWEELSGARAIWGTPWVCGGDFNVVRYPYERVGNSRITRAMRDFSDYTLEEVLMDLPLEGDRFTWSNGTASSRLDRFVVSPEWEGGHLDVRQYCLPRIVSDHKSVILEEGGSGQEVVGRIRSFWESIISSSQEAVVVEGRLEEVELGEVERVRRVELKAEIGRFLMAEEMSNYIGKIRIEGVLHEDQASVAGGIVGYYDKLYKESEQWRLRVDGLSMPALSTEEADSLVRPFGEEESLMWQILDASLVANEYVDGWLRSKEPRALCKLDIEKAYDHISWEFLLYLLEKLGFGDKWCSWMKSCISTVKFSVLLVNGLAKGFFSGTRGLRQGDPLSPFLSITVMDVLRRFISRVVSSGRLNGFRVGESSQEVIVLHLLFADDTLILCKDDPKEVACLRDILLCFQAASGLKINLVKSEIIQVSFLAPPLSPRLRGELVVDRLERKLDSWKRQYLSKGGKLTLIKSSLSSMPTYFLSLLTIPKSIASRLEKLMRDFLWNGLENAPGIHLVAWKFLNFPKKGGGLGIRDLVLFNKALLGKWIWRFAVGEDKLWCRVLRGKYGTIRGDWRTKAIDHFHETGLWKGIMQVWGDFCPHVFYQLGNGNKISFWYDAWCCQESLRKRFLELFALAFEQAALVADYWTLSPIRASQPGTDKWRWKTQGKGRFTVSSFYQTLTGLGDPTFPWKGIWVNSVPSKVCFFGWAAAKGAILTIDNLRRRSIIVTEWCYMCKRDAETTDHLLIHCDAARELWNLVFSIFGIQWVMPGTVRDLFACWSWKSNRGNRRLAWKMVLLSLFWCIWRERNLRAFEDI
ncbi:hypothetical protein Acr_00g0069200 [Actinidia rufa]|uniref:Reverse transcriptase domain-containing protein n=1 Tax=Actinidia rufa TaxID=165716 RepID=A0A7J0DQX0_9ERIC|nr:hypothetical protein Acr_00g0069200 [Actinidia rufa]